MVEGTGTGGYEEIDRFSNVFLAVRMTKQKDPAETMHLTLFRDVPTTQLHLLLPDVEVEMSAADKAMVLFMGGVGGLTVAAKTAAVAFSATGGAIANGRDSHTAMTKVPNLFMN